MSKLSKAEKPKVLVYDIETSPLIGNVWSLWQQNVGLNQLRKDWYVMSWAAKWMGEETVYYASQRNEKNQENDKEILIDLHDMLSEADIVITHNGMNFDEKKLNSRFLSVGLPPVSKPRHIDTCRIAKKHFSFTSNKLEFLTDKFCTYHKKLKHDKFPGFSLWAECVKNNKEAWDEMIEYNIQDVRSLEELYIKLAPWDDTVNFNLYHDRDEYFCNCGSNQFSKNGYYTTNSGKFHKYVCKNCGKHSRGKKNILTKKKRKSLGGRIT